MVSDVSAMLVDTTILRPAGPPGRAGAGAASKMRCCCCGGSVEYSGSTFSGPTCPRGSRQLTHRIWDAPERKDALLLLRRQHQVSISMFMPTLLLRYFAVGSKTVVAALSRLGCAGGMQRARQHLSKLARRLRARRNTTKLQMCNAFTCNDSVPPAKKLDTAQAWCGQKIA